MDLHGRSKWSLLGTAETEIVKWKIKIATCIGAVVGCKYLLLKLRQVQITPA
jgi:hypothetical protein